MKNRLTTCLRKQTLLVCTFALVCLAGVTPQAHAAAKQGLKNLPLEGRYAISAAIGYDQPAYHARMDGEGLVADNTGHGLTTLFGHAGVKIGSGSKGFSLQPVAWGYGEEMTALLPGVPQAVGNMVTNARGAIGEWYINGPLGLQQGFTVAELHRQAPAC